MFVAHKVDVADRPVPAEEDIPHIKDDFMYEYDAFEYTLTHENKGEGKLLSSKDENFNVGYVADIIIDVSRETSKRLD